MAGHIVTIDQPNEEQRAHIVMATLAGLDVSEVDGLWTIRYPDDRPLADQATERLQQLADRRYQAMMVTPLGPGVWITSDDTAIARINAKISAMERGGAPTIDWKLDSGAYLNLTLDQLKATGLAMDAHWTACWANEAAMAARIVAAPDAAALDAVDITSGWPA